MQQYLAQQLEPEEMRLVETHLCECMLCSDAIDGFMESGIPSAGDLHPLKIQLQSLIKPVVDSAPTIIQPITDKSSLKPHRKNFRWAWAASILLFMGLGGYGIYILNDHGEALVHEKAKTQSETKDLAYHQPENASGEIIQLSVDSMELQSQSNSEDPSTTQKSIELDSKEKPAIQLRKPPNEESENLDTRDTKIQEVEKTMAANAPETDDSKFNELTESESSASVDLKKETAPAVAKEAAPVPIKKKVVSGAGLKNNNDRSLYSSPQSNQLNYSSSNRNANESNSFEEEVRQKASSGGSFRKGRKAVQKGNYLEAIQILEPLVSQSQGEEKEEIMYYLAQAYIESGQSDKAQSMLTALSSSRKFSNKARELQSESQKARKK